MLRPGLICLLALIAFVTACGSWPYASNDKVAVDVTQRSQHCGTPDRPAALHYFRNADAFGNWQARRAADGLMPLERVTGAVLVLEMGRRTTAGYTLEVEKGASRIVDDTLRLRVNWRQPADDAMVAQVLTSPCLVVAAPAGDYTKVVAVDQDGGVRARVSAE